MASSSEKNLRKQVKPRPPLHDSHDKTIDTDSEDTTANSSNLETTNDSIDLSTSSSNNEKSFDEKSNKDTSNISGKKNSPKSKSPRQLPRDERYNTVEPTAKKDKNFEISLLVTLILVAVAIAFYYFNSVETDSHSEKMEKSNMEIYKEKMQSLQNEFPSQNNKLWKIVRVAMQEHHDKKDNLQPAVLMLASNADANPTMQCLASKLADIYSHNCSQPKFVVPENEFKHLSPESAKVLLDNKISSQFQAGSCASVVRHFELIPPAATKVFYQFCENDNAPYKNVAVILTLQVEPGDWSMPYPNLDNLPPKFWDRVVDGFLTHTLATGDPVVMTTDMIGALLSRITPSVVWVRRENDLHC
uniref:torsin-1A-interacting protein 2-like isoform X2 n=1 Tax=Ciona intestinalis TaxID=7719 RepID=UPI00089DCCE8|nr:torsin-1A-interacting protein 2-like isoform X2 [Ciona intestinalis]|eukprot:XP_018669051.1 torsin-1A-interacting protein 2-like isoform X2 [Ciona intestinalis]